MPRKPRPFVALQSAESRLIGALAGELAADWLLEIAPATSPSPTVPLRRSRLLVNEEGCCWPFRGELSALPLDSESVPALLLRHVWQPGMGADPLSEALRVLKPGGWIVSVSANPWHPAAWRELGRGARWLPSWPHFQFLHARRQLDLGVPARAFWRGLVPGLSPVLVLLARKPQRPARVLPMKFRQPRFAPGSAAVAQCRAA